MPNRLKKWRELSFRAQRGICFSQKANQKQIPRANTALGMTRLGVGFLLFVWSLCAQDANAQATYTLKTPPVLRVKSGDTVAVQTPSPSTPDQEEKPIIYVKHLEPPLHYPAVARAAQLQGTVIVKLTITADGAVLTAESSSGYPLLRDETEKLVKKWTFGCANCSPRVPYEKTIKFIYRLEGEGISYDDSRVVMDLPDVVTVTASPRECDHCPRKKSTPGGTK